MILPPELQKLIQATLAEVRSDPEHKITPVQRLSIYNSFDTGEKSCANTAFLRLQIITAKYVLPIWKSAEPTNNLAQYLIEMAEQLVQNGIDKKAVQAELDKIWIEMDTADINSSWSEPAFAAAAAAFEAFRILVVGFDKWEGWPFCEGDNDDDLAMWGNDSAKWASIAVAGWLQYTTPLNNQKRLRFWEWWLSEAIPEAWEVAQN